MTNLKPGTHARYREGPRKLRYRQHACKREQANKSARAGHWEKESRARCPCHSIGLRLNFPQPPVAELAINAIAC